MGVPGAILSWRVGPAPSKRRRASVYSGSGTKPSARRNGPPRGTFNTFSQQKKVAPRSPLKRATAEKQNDRPQGGAVQATKTESKEEHRAWSLSVSKIANHGNSDPFGVTVIPLSAFRNHLISLWKPFFFDASWPTPARADQKMDYSPVEVAWNRQVSLVIHDEASMSAMLGVGAFMRAGDTTDGEQKAVLRSQGFNYMNGALKLLRQRLAIPPKEALSIETMIEVKISAAYYLGCSTAFTGDMDSARTHLKGIKSIADEVGGFRTLTWPMKCQAVALDMVVAHTSLQDAVFPHVEYDPGDYWEKKTAKERHALMQAYREREDKLDTISAHAEYLTRAYRELLAIHNLARKITDVTRRTRMLLWAHMKKYVLAKKVLDIRLNWNANYASQFLHGPISADAIKPSLDLCRCVAMRYAEQITFNSAAGVVSVYTDYAELRKILSRPDCCRYVHRELLLWVFAIASIVEEIVNKAEIVNKVENVNEARELLRKRWHLTRFLGLAQMLGLTTPEQIALVMKQFLYDELAMGKHVRTLLAHGVRLSRLSMETYPESLDAGEIDEDSNYFYRAVGTTTTTTGNVPRSVMITDEISMEYPNLKKGVILGSISFVSRSEKICLIGEAFSSYWQGKKE